MVVRETAGHGVWVEDATEVSVTTVQDVMSVLEVGTTNRVVGATQMSECSSRSHCVFVITGAWRRCQRARPQHPHALHRRGVQPPCASETV